MTEEGIGMSTPIRRVITSGSFSLDGGTWDVDNNIWLVGEEGEHSDVVVFDAAHDALAHPVHPLRQSSQILQRDRSFGLHTSHTVRPGRRLWTAGRAGCRCRLRPCRHVQIATPSPRRAARFPLRGTRPSTSRSTPAAWAEAAEGCGQNRGRAFHSSIDTAPTSHTINACVPI
jgi:hypothetical protein